MNDIQIFFLILISVIVLVTTGLAVLVHWMSAVVLRKYFQEKSKFIDKIGGQE